MFLYIYIYIYTWYHRPTYDIPILSKKKKQKNTYTLSHRPMRAKTMGHTTTKQTYPFSTKKKKKKPILWSLSHRPTTNMSRAEGPKAPKPKTKKQREGRRKGKGKKKKKILTAIPISDSEQRQARGEVERVRVWETYRRQEEGGGALVVGLLWRQGQSRVETLRVSDWILHISSSIEFLCVPNLLVNSKSFYKMSAGTLSLSFFLLSYVWLLRESREYEICNSALLFCNFFYGKKVFRSSFM